MDRSEYAKLLHEFWQTVLVPEIRFRGQVPEPWDSVKRNLLVDPAALLTQYVMTLHILKAFVGKIS